MMLRFAAISTALAAWLASISAASAQTSTSGPITNASSTYSQLVTSGRKALEAGKGNDALVSAVAATEKEPQRFEAYALAALVYQAKGDLPEARKYMDQALERAPEEKKPQLKEIAKTFETPAPERAPAVASVLTGEARRKYDALLLIVEDADKAKAPEQRVKLLREFMAKSAEFLALAPMQTNVWLIRGAAAVELDYPGTGWLVGRHLKEMGLENSDAPRVRKVIAALERKDWLGPNMKSRDWSKWTTDQVRIAANQGDSEAQFCLASWYFIGRGVTKDNAEAVKWFRKAAEAGNADAQCNLGRLHANGQLVPKDGTEAVKWFRKAAEQGDAVGQIALGWLYANGELVPKDGAEAVRWYQKAAEVGDIGAQNTLGEMYANGQGVPKDEAEAVKWYRKSAEQGNGYGQMKLGQMYENGHGVPKAAPEAVKWYRKAADLGNVDAQAALKRLQAGSQ